MHAIFRSAATSSSSSHTEQDRRAMMKLMTPVFPIICANCLVEIRSTIERDTLMISIYLVIPPFFSFFLSLLALSRCFALSRSVDPPPPSQLPSLRPPASRYLLPSRSRPLAPPVGAGREAWATSFIKGPCRPGRILSKLRSIHAVSLVAAPNQGMPSLSLPLIVAVVVRTIDDGIEE